MDGRTWVIDAANVVGSRPDGWWRDRAGAAGRLHTALLDLVAAYPAPSGGWVVPECIVLVLEGAARAGVAAGVTQTGPVRSGQVPSGPVPSGAVPFRHVRVDVVHAAGSGDDTIVAEASVRPAPVLVVTADRALADRVAEVGASVVGPRTLLALFSQNRS